MVKRYLYSSIQDAIKDEVILALTQTGSTVDYMNGVQYIQNLICKDVGIEGWSQQLCEAIVKLEEGLYIPSPLHMKFKHVHLILDGSISEENEGLKKYITKDALTEEEKKKVKFCYTVTNDAFTNSSEADASVRVFALLFNFISCHSVKCSAVTDFLMLSSTDPERMSVIEVKKATISCTFGIESNEVAQALREVHIVFLSHPELKSLLLILTNSLDWSFALVERGVKEKIKVTSTLHFNIKSYGVDIFDVY